jgi:RNA polymerase sigma factor (sigma-70 family)
MGGTTLERAAPEATDGELLARVRGGEQSAFAELWARYEPDARSFARYLTRSPHETDDVVAEAFAKVLRAIHGGAGPTENFKPYLMTAIRRTWWRRTEQRPDIPLDDGNDVRPPGSATVEQELADEEFDGAAGRALRSLSPRWQTVLWHTEIEGRSSAEVGELLGLSPNAAAALIGRAREGLRRAYLREVEGPIPASVAA